MSPADARTWGVRWEFSVTRTRCVPSSCLGHGLVRTGGRSRGRHADFAGRTGSRSGRSAEPFGLFASTLSGGRLAGKMARRRAQARRRKGATGALRRRPRSLRVSGRAAISRHRRQRESPRRTRPPRRDQSRDQSCDPADERSGSIRRNRRLEFAARHLRQRRRRLRRLCDRQVRRLAPGRHLAATICGS